jgi:hypothetical protein
MKQLPITSETCSAWLPQVLITIVPLGATVVPFVQIFRLLLLVVA